MIITIHIKLIREHCEIVGEKLRLVFYNSKLRSGAFFVFGGGKNIGPKKNRLMAGYYNSATGDNDKRPISIEISTNIYKPFKFMS